MNRSKLEILEELSDLSVIAANAESTIWWLVQHTDMSDSPYLKNRSWIDCYRANSAKEALQIAAINHADSPEIVFEVLCKESEVN